MSAPLSQKRLARRQREGEAPGANGLHLGIDIGGSSAKVSLLDDTMRVVSSALHELPDALDDPDGNRRARIELVGRSIREAAAGRSDGLSVAVATPGIVDAEHRRIAALPGKLSGLEGVDWTLALQQPHGDSWPPRIVVLNDAHAAVLGEARLGAGRGATDIAMLTLGTGVGGGVMIDGRLFEGRNRRAAHLGHISLDPRGAPSVFPTPGSLEWHVGDAYVSQRTGGRYASTTELVDGVHRGEEAASAAWARTVRALAVGIASIINVLDPERVILGGGLVAVGEVLFEPLRRELDDVEWRPGGESVPVLTAELGRFSGSIGAAVYGRERSMT